jgi:chromosome segregation ATPase
MLTCWCNTNEKEKTAAIEAGEANIARLEAELGEAAAKIKELKEKIKQTKDDYNKEFESLNKASAMRMKENKENHGEESDLVMAIKAAEQALVVLSEQHPELVQIHKAARGLQGVRVQLLSRVLQSSEVAVFKAFVEKAANADSSSSFLAIPGMQSYAPQSGQIVGILKQLKEDMEKDLGENQANEKKAQDEFEALKAASETEMATLKKQQEQAESDLAAITEKHAQAAQELEDTEEQLALDKEFLANLKKKCEASDKEFAERMKSRMEEIAAVQDTIKFLNSDEAYEMFDKTVNSAFTQVANSVKTVMDSKAKEQQERLRDRAGAALAKVAGHNASPQLVLIMTSVHLDAFTKVIAEIDKMTAELKKQQQDEVEQRDYCIAELNKNNLTLEAEYDTQASLMAKIADLESSIDAMKKDIEAKTQEIADMQTEMKRSSEDREAENADFQQTAMDQRMTQMILTKALDRMKQVYALLQQRARARAIQEHLAPGAPHTQTSATDTDPGSGPARFTKYEKNAGGGKVVAMIEGIINDSKTLEADAIASEQDSQTAYENFMKESNDSITKLSEAIANLSAAKGKAEEDLTMSKADLGSTNKELEGLHETEADLHGSCDYLLKNFEVSQAARKNELDGLAEAKAILSGMK